MKEIKMAVHLVVPMLLSGCRNAGVQFSTILHTMNHPQGPTALPGLRTHHPIDYKEETIPGGSGRYDQQTVEFLQLLERFGGVASRSRKRALPRGYVDVAEGSLLPQMERLTFEGGVPGLTWVCKGLESGEQKGGVESWRAAGWC